MSAFAGLQVKKSYPENLFWPIGTQKNPVGERKKVLPKPVVPKGQNTSGEPQNPMVRLIAISMRPKLGQREAPNKALSLARILANPRKLEITPGEKPAPKPLRSLHFPPKRPSPKKTFERAFLSASLKFSF